MSFFAGEFPWRRELSGRLLPLPLRAHPARSALSERPHHAAPYASPASPKRVPQDRASAARRLRQNSPRCKDRIPGARLNFNYPTKAGYAKFNWIIVVPEYYNMKYIAHCEEMYDVNFAFNALSGDV